MIHGAVPHPNASLSPRHIKLQSISGHSAKVSVRGEGSGDEGAQRGGWEEGVEGGGTKCQRDGDLGKHFLC